MITGICSAAPPRNNPHIPAMSNPPTFESTSSGSDASGSCRKIARRIARTLRFRPSPDNPAPRPVTISGSMPRKTAVIALLVVVFPIPISPVASSSYPRFFNSCALAMPASIAATACALVIAGSFVIFFVP